MMQNENNSDVHSFDDVMDAMLGAPGTQQREQFRREAYAYCVGTIIHQPSSIFHQHLK